MSSWRLPTGDSGCCWDAALGEGTGVNNCGLEGAGMSAECTFSRATLNASQAAAVAQGVDMLSEWMGDDRN